MTGEGMAKQGKGRQGRAGEQAWRRRKGVKVTDVSDFEATRISLRALQAMPHGEFTGTIDYVERLEPFNKWRCRTEDRLEVFFTDAHSVMLNDGMEQTIIEAYGTDAGAWTGRLLTVFVECSKRVNKKTGEITTTAVRALKCHALESVDTDAEELVATGKAVFDDEPSD